MRKCSLSIEWTPPDSKYCIVLLLLLLFNKACGILITQPEIIPGRLAVRAQSPDHWTARVSPISVEFNTEQVKLWFHPESQTVREDGVSGELWIQADVSGQERCLRGETDTGSTVRLGGILIQTQSSGSKETQMRKQLVCIRNQTGPQRSVGGGGRGTAVGKGGQVRQERSGTGYWWHRHDSLLLCCFPAPQTGEWPPGKWAALPCRQPGLHRGHL